MMSKNRQWKSNVILLRKSLNWTIYKTQNVNVDIVWNSENASQFHIHVNRFKHKHNFSGALWDLIQKVHLWGIV